MDYYTNQQQRGLGVPLFQGSRLQRGHGLGNILSGLFRSALPMLKRGLAFFGKQALRTGAQIANDVADGESFTESTKKRVSERIKGVFNPENFSSQTGSGARRTSKRKIKLVISNLNKIKKKKRRKFNDIFD